MKKIKYLFLIGISVFILSCTDDDLDPFAQVEPLTMVFNNVNVESQERNVDVAQSNSTINDIDYVVENLSVNNGESANIIFDLSKNNEIFTYSEFDILIDSFSSNNGLTISEALTEISINDESLLSGHPIHPALGTLTSNILDTNNQLILNFRETGTYTIRFNFRTEENNNPVINIQRSYINLNIVVN